MIVESKLFSDEMARHWESLGHVATKPLMQAWGQMAHAFNSHIEGKNKEKWTVLQLPTGAGKTKGLELYCSLLPDKNHPGVAIITRLTKEAQGLADNINELAGKKIAFADYSEHRNYESDIHHTPVLIVTHSAYLDAMDIELETGIAGGFRWADFVEWRGGKRRLTVIDESMDFVKSCQFNISDLITLRGFLPKNITRFHADIVQTLEQLIEKLSLLAARSKQVKERTEVLHSGFWEITNPDHLRQLYYKIRYLHFDMLMLGHEDKDQRASIKKTYELMLKSAKEIVSSWGLYSRKWGEHQLTKASFAFPDEIKNAVILDATAVVNPMYDYLGSSQKRLSPPHSVRSYRNVTLHVYFNHQVGKGHIKDNIKTLLPPFVQFIAKKIGKNRKVLFCVHKATEPHLEKYKKRFGDSTAIGHWYAIDGLNDWQDFDTMVIYGLPYLDNSLPLASILALQGSKKPKVNPALTDTIRKQGTVYERQLRIVKLVQAINRVRCRKVIDENGNCDKTEIYLFLNKTDDGEKLLEGIAQQMPDIQIVRCYDGPLAKRVDDRSPLGKEILKRLEKLPVGKYPALKLLDEVIAETGKGSLAGLRQFLRRYNNAKSPAARQMKEQGIKYLASKKGGRGNMGMFVKLAVQ